jgi:myo-inositol-1(or 4)-monophosphatase
VVDDCQRSTDSPLTPDLLVAVAAASAAGEALLGAFAGPGGGGSGPGRRRRNGPHDVVTALDARAERLIARHLRAVFPYDGFVGEEHRPRRPDRRRGPARTWIVDPIDGTVMFAAGIPFFSISIALAVGDRIEVGVVHDPVHGETFTAIRGAGACLVTGDLGTSRGSSDQGAIHANGARALRVRRLARVADAVVALDPGDPDDPDAVARIDMARARVRVVRTFGSTALSLAWLAAGRLDGVLQVRGLQAVDIAAAGLIAAEAGAIVTDAAGGPWLEVSDLAHGRGIAAGSRAVHEAVLVSRPQLGAAASK